MCSYDVVVMASYLMSDRGGIVDRVWHMSEVDDLELLCSSLLDVDQVCQLRLNYGTNQGTGSSL